MSSYEMLNAGGMPEGWNDRRINGQNVMLFLYAAVVAFAFVLVINKNFETPEQILADEELAAQDKLVNQAQIEASNGVMPEVYEDENSE